jgi:hypothetical protein
MTKQERTKLLKQILWDYNITAQEVEAVLNGQIQRAGHYSREMIFQKLIESYSWFTIVQIFTPYEIRDLLTGDVINRLRTPSLRNKYEFVRKRIQEIIPFAG